MIGSPQRVKIQRSLVQNLSKIKQQLKIIGCFLTFLGIKIPQRITTTFGGQNNIKIIQHCQNTQCAYFQQNLTTFKNQYHRGFLTF